MTRNEIHTMRTVLAFDRSARTRDSSGRLHVAGCRISKANVRMYAGREIPGGEKLGLVLDRQYTVYCDPTELAKAAAGFENSPLMYDHVVVTAEAPAQDLIAGSLSNVQFDYPYLVAD